MAQLAVVPEAHDQIIGLGDLVGGRYGGPNRCEGVERFAEPAAGLPGPPALAACRHVNQAGIAEHRASPIRLTDLLGRAFDHQCQFGLVHERPWHGVFRQHDGIARTDHGIRVLHEHVERARLALGMLPVIGDAAEDFARPRQRRLELDLAGRHGLALVGELDERGLQPVVVVDNALHGELRRVALLHRAGDIDHAAVGHQTRQNLAVGRRLEQHKFHEVLP